jgi:predicted hydrolase (HD superfamily)
VGQVEWARDLAQSLLAAPLPRRWAHTQGVAAQAERLAPILGEDADLLTAAAWLHDIGYSPNLVATRFHPLDGACYLRDSQQADTRLCRLVAHHSCAIIEAEERGIAEELTTEFPLERDDFAKALIYCDMTIGPDGQSTSVDVRLAGIVDRYGSDHLITRSIQRSTPTLRAAVDCIELRAVQKLGEVVCTKSTVPR